MTPQKQLFRHKPAEGQIGDCYRTCIACVLDLAPENVPHVYHPDVSGGVFGEPERDPVEIMRAFLRERGFCLVGFPVSRDVELRDLLGVWAATIVGENVHFLITGTSKNLTNHVVVARVGEIAWDPSLDDSGLVGPPESGDWWVEFIGALV